MKKVEVELAWAYIKGQKVIDAFDKRAANNLLQCIALGRELDRPKVSYVARRGGPATVIEGDFREAAE